MDAEQQVITKRGVLWLVIFGKELTDRQLQELLRLLETSDELTDIERQTYIYYLGKCKRKLLRLLAKEKHLTDQQSQELLLLLRTNNILTSPERDTFIQFLASKDNPSAAEWLELLIANLPVHFWGLVRSVEKKLYSFAYSLTRNPDDAVEIVGDVMIKVYTKWSGPECTAEYMRQLKLYGYLYSSTYHQFINSLDYHTKHISPMVSHETEQEESSSPVDLLDDPSQLVEPMLELKDRLKLMQRLPEIQQKALWMGYAGHSYEEIAEELDVPIGAIRSGIHNARGSLQEMEGTQEEIERLPKRLRKMLWLHYGDSLSNQEISERLGLALRDVEFDLKIGKALLRESEKMTPELIERLPEKLRDIFRLRYGDGLSPQKIAKELDQPLYKVNDNLKYGKTLLRQSDKIMQGLLERLPGKSQNVLMLHYYQDLNPERIADELDLPLRQVEKDLKIGKSLLSSALKERVALDEWL